MARLNTRKTAIEKQLNITCPGKGKHPPVQNKPWQECLL